MKKFLEKIQKLPEDERKIILWATVIILGLVIFIWYFTNIKLGPINKEQLQSDLKINELKDNLNKVPNVEMPKF
jgi:hypothetical protein